jgi:Putative Ig domain/Abnormal spindle-like microcephaly-assoc'd, ASPM-SPD-2-Hydin
MKKALIFLLSFLIVIPVAGKTTHGNRGKGSNGSTSTLVIVQTSLPSGTVGVAYSQTLTASGGTAPYTWAQTGGALPPGITFTTATATLAGTPTAAGVYSFAITVTDSASPPATYSEGFGLSIAGLSVTLSPASLAYGNQQQGTSSGAQTVTLTNTGTITTLNISSIAVTSDYSKTTTCGSTLAAGASCTISVTFSPTIVGADNGTLTVTDDAPGSPQTAALTGSGTSASQAFVAVTWEPPCSLSDPHNCPTTGYSGFGSGSVGTEYVLHSTTDFGGTQALQINYDNLVSLDQNYFVFDNYPFIERNDVYIKAGFELVGPNSGGSKYGLRKLFYIKTDDADCAGSTACGSLVLTSESTPSTGGNPCLYLAWGWQNTTEGTKQNASPYSTQCLNWATPYEIEVAWHFHAANNFSDSIQVWLNGTDISSTFTGGGCTWSPCLQNIQLRPVTGTGSTYTYKYFEVGRQLDPWGAAGYNAPICSIARSGSVVTVNTCQNNWFVTGNYAVIRSVGYAGATSFNITTPAITVDNSTRFHYTQAGEDGSGTGGTVSPVGNESRWIGPWTISTGYIP